MSKPLIRFKGCKWVGTVDSDGLKSVANGPDKDHWTARYWMSPEGELFAELPCEGNHVTEYLPKAVLRWLVSP